MQIVSLILAAEAWAQAPSAHEQSIRLIEEGRYVAARDHAAAAIREAKASTPPCEVALLLFDQGTAEHLLVRYQEAADTFTHALDLCGKEATAPPRFRAALLAELGTVHAVLGMFGRASSELKSALEIAETLPRGEERVARVYESLGVLASRQGLVSQAERHFRNAIEILETVVGRTHPDVAAVQLTLAGILLQQDRVSEALPVAQSAHATLASRFGASHPDTIHAALTIAEARTANAPAEAESLLREALSAWPDYLPPNHGTAMRIWNAIGIAQLAQKRAKEAAKSIEHALEIARAVAGPDGAETMRIMYNYARCLKAAGRKKDYAAVLASANRIRSEKGYAELRPHTIDIRSFRGR
jgi:tetratricopeptide (TPR) repeat protein